MNELMYVCMYVCLFVCYYYYVCVYIYVCLLLLPLLLLLLLLLLLIIIITMDVYVWIQYVCTFFCPHVRTPASVKMFLCSFIIGSRSIMRGHIPVLVKIWPTQRTIYIKPYTHFCTYPLHNSLKVYRREKYYEENRRYVAFDRDSVIT